MTTQINPAWQRKSVSSNRLAKISAGFLSDDPEMKNDKDPCRVIPFLLDNPEQSWITLELGQVLKQRGHDTFQTRIDETCGDSRNPLRDALDAHPADGEYCLLSLTSAETVRACRLDHVVLLVPANLDSVRTAYQRIKLLSERNVPEIGVVLVGPRDQHAGWRYFRKLAVGSLRYLDVPLLNLGFLPEQVTPEHGQTNQHRTNFLARISERLLRSEFYSSCTSEKAARGKP